MLKKTTLALSLTLSCLSGLAMAATPATVADTALGKVLVDSKGMTLYTFAKDSAGKSACNGPCAQNWPPLAAGAYAKDGDGYSVITRDDGSKQWAYKDLPLYGWVKDSKPGDTTGEGVGQAWHVAKP
ncbi:COG4315 family predicted lipoprotein [Pseudomonas sp. NPDC089554]|uniref:COG4315 family predicted lipoprotein n=1 Tax=Pseudomonas sp. NPDC089554 TaxID=3390653 RepID=UPI003D0763B6